MTAYSSFFTKEEEQDIVNAIRQAEQNTSAEIRVHLENKIPEGTTLKERALHTFYTIGMDKTAQRNGVLFYFAIQNRQFLVFGDHGIDKKVPGNFWVTIKDTVLSAFQKKAYKNGLIAGITKVGSALKTYSPHEATDINELSDEISKS